MTLVLGFVSETADADELYTFHNYIEENVIYFEGANNSLLLFSSLADR